MLLAPGSLSAHAKSRTATPKVNQNAHFQLPFTAKTKPPTHPATRINPYIIINAGIKFLIENTKIIIEMLNKNSKIKVE